jgi:hypothetical protein
MPGAALQSAGWLLLAARGSGLRRAFELVHGQWEQEGEERLVSGRNRHHRSMFERGKWRALVLGQNEGPVTGRVLCSWTNEDKSGDWRLWEVQITALESSST